MALVTEMLYLYPKENSEPHKTKNYELVHLKENPIPVLRRGLKFTMAIRFQDRGFQEEKDEVKIYFNYGPKPSLIRGTQGLIKVKPSKKMYKDEEQKHWFSNVLNVGEDTVTIEVFSPPSIPWGLWGITVETSLINSSENKNIFEYEDDLWFICNPWNCHDMVYMPDTRNLEEYVLCDVGKIWVGPVSTTKGRDWIFGQFDACVLPAAWLMFEKSGLEYSRRGDPIKLTRIISKMVNSNDDDGILVGRWDGDYEDGTAPSGWTGSVPILEQYLETQSPVAYGQCWVFSGVVTTICRAIGIPSRVVSNLVSAHDANGTLTVDKYISATHEELSIEPEDSIWNYHVWNDVYMQRPDLPIGYGGWQAIDATPQETSDGYFQCGPASLEAVKKGQVGLSYDVGFVIASVNADLMTWKEDKDSDWGYSRIYRSKYHIGRFILTKKPFLYDFNGDKDRQDVTCEYKPKEGTRAERLSLLNAVRGTEAAKKLYELPDQQMEDVVFDLKDLDEINIGEDFSVVVEIKNKSSEVRNVKMALSAATVYYNGVKADVVVRKEGELTVNPNSSTRLDVKVKADDYLEKLVEYSIMKISAVATVTQTKQTWADEDDFQIIKPKIEFQLPDEIYAGKTNYVSIHFRNPLKRTLTNCKFRVSGPKLMKIPTIHHPDVEAEATVQTGFEIQPNTAGDRPLVVTFSSKELLDITGSVEIKVID